MTRSFTSPLTSPLAPSRRRFLRQSASLATAGALFSVTPQAFANLARDRNLAFDHTHTREQIALVYANGDRYLPKALNRLNYFMRDHYSGKVGVMDPKLFDILYRLRSSLGARQSFHVISGYRHPATNEMLRKTRGGGVAKRSLHMDGKAVDIRLPGVPLTELRDAALALKAGGVGFYPRDQFVHIDTGAVRNW